MFSDVNSVARFNPSSGNTGIFRDNQVNNIAADTQTREFYLVNDTWSGIYQSRWLPTSNLTCVTIYRMPVQCERTYGDVQLITPGTYGFVVYRQTSNMSRNLIHNKLVDHADVVGASSVGATSSPSTKHLASVYWAKTTAKRDENHLSFVFLCALYKKCYGRFCCGSILFHFPRTLHWNWGSRMICLFHRQCNTH